MLTNTECKNAGAKAKPYKLSDGGGLVLEVKPPNRQGRVVKAWRLRFTFAGKESMLALGEYPAVSLKEARKRREEARDLIAKGISPVMQRQLDKLTRHEELDRKAQQPYVPPEPTGPTCRYSADVDPISGALIRR